MGICKGLRVRRALAVLLVLVSFLLIAVLPLYDRASPELAGIPMFYWYQLLWLLILSASLAVAQALTGGETP